jgi:2-deoxy-D-gluconate 3-dehydrogenase
MVTGTSTGLGRAIALGLADAGYDLAVTELELAPLQDLVGEINGKGCRAAPVKLDLREEASIAAALATAIDGLGRLDVLVNNAGRALKKDIVDVSWAEWDDVMGSNLKGAYFLSAGFARHCMESRRGGAIVNIASTHGMTGLPGRSVYGISKGGLIQMTRMMAIEWARADIRVNAVAPTTVMTPSRQAMLSDPALREEMLRRIPTGRFATEAEIAAAVRYLAGPDAGSVTGHTLAVDGGLTAI